MTIGGKAQSVAVSQDGQTLVTASTEDTVRLWDTSTGSLRATLAGHAGPVQPVAFGPDGRSPISLYGDSELRAWNTTTGRARALTTRHISAVWSVAVSPDGGTLVDGSAGPRTIRPRDVSAGKQRAVLSGHGDQVRAAAPWPAAATTPRVWGTWAREGCGSR
ncbi:hypothetical protein AB0I51_11280 [Streptomyces sp. NPDC050549]|uniref:WD40 repeat domain-containing protein n=1 Tax=Streptomyces sp. NPDC050549 TaxID=3155406 RepID=UPI003445D466